MTLSEINDCNREHFVQALGGIFEGWQWVAERAWRKRPFLSFDDLSTKLIQEVLYASADEQLALLLSVPALEGMDEELLEKYRKKFGFPFIYSVKDAGRAAMTESLNRRLRQLPDPEFQVALGHTFRIARSRLEEIVEADTR